MLGRILGEIFQRMVPEPCRPIAWRRGTALLQAHASIAVVIATVGRSSLLRAVRSIFAQDIEKPIQVLIGIDIDKYGQSNRIRETLLEECPRHVDLIWWQPGYSTSQRHGGIHRCFFGGSLRTALSFLANAPVVTYLDDDDWYAPDHLRRMLSAIEGKSWAYSLSYYADGENGTPLAIDEIESVGVGAGIYRDTFGGFVRPSALAIDKTRLGHILHLWSEAQGPAGDAEDRLIFSELKGVDHGFTGGATVCYALDPKDIQHELRLAFLRQKGIDHVFVSRADSCR